MKSCKKIIIPEKEKIVYNYSCDLCDVKMDDLDTIKNYYDFYRSRIYYSAGSMYPEGGSEEGEEFYICCKCMKEKIFPFIKNKYNIQPTKLFLSSWEEF